MVVAVIVAGTISACATSVRQPSAECDEAFKTAGSSLERHYATHPLFGAEYDAIYEDGDVSAEEQAQLDEWAADEEEKFDVIVAPTLDNCDGQADFYAGAYAQGPDSDWGVHGTAAIGDDELREIFLSTWCAGNEARNACVSD